MKNVLIIGASGMIGGLILEDCLKRADVGAVTSLVRRPSGISHPKLTEATVEDFLDYAPLTEHLAGQDICFFCLGVYTGQVDKTTFRRITVDYTVAFAQALHAASPEAVFCFLSGQGADRSETSSIMFARDKGAAENALLNIGFPRLHIFRPGYIYPVTPRREPNFSYRLIRLFYKPISALYPNIGLTSETLARAMVDAGFEGHGADTLENRDIRAMDMS